MRLPHVWSAGTARRTLLSWAAVGLAMLAAMAFAPPPALASAPAHSTTVYTKLLSTDPYADTFSAHKTEVEPDVTAYGATIVSAFQVSRYSGGGSANIGWATSLNGGRTWQSGFLPYATITGTPPGSYLLGSDASVAYDARYHTWLISWLAIASPTVIDVAVSRSPDGIHWSAPVTVAARGEFLDKPWISCDNSRLSPFFGNCYTEFEDVTENDLIFMATSADGGLTWPKLSNTADMAEGLGGQPVVQPGGRVIVPIVVFTASGDTIASFISDDGGATWSVTHLIAKVAGATDAGGIRDGGDLPSARIDGSGRVYTVWSDCRFEPGCTANDLVLSTSADGITWAAPKLIPIDPVGSGADHFTPGLAVDPLTAGAYAHLALTYYYYPQANCTFTTCQLNVGFVSSVNGGRSWSRPLHVAGPMMLGWLAPTSSGYMAGDYCATAIVPGTLAAFPLFAAAGPPTGTVLDENTYTAYVSVTGGPVTASTVPEYASQARPLPAPARRTAF